MRALNITTSETTVAEAGNRDFIHIYNNSDTTIYVKYDGASTAVTTSNGLPIVAGATLMLDNDGGKNIFNKKVTAIHGGSGNKEIRIQGD